MVKRPSLSVVDSLVPIGPLATIFAPGITAPDASRTTPARLPLTDVSFWAKPVSAKAKTKAVMLTIEQQSLSMLPPYMLKTEVSVEQLSELFREPCWPPEFIPEA